MDSIVDEDQTLFGVLLISEGLGCPAADVVNALRDKRLIENDDAAELRAIIEDEK